MKCDLHRARLPARAFANQLACPRCGEPVPASAAASSEGSDYVYHFCGNECLAGWCQRLRRRH